MGNRKRLTVEISGEDKGIAKPFRKTRQESDETRRKVEGDGEEAGKNWSERFAKGLKGKLPKILGGFGSTLQKHIKPIGAAVGIAFAGSFITQVAGALAGGIQTLGAGLGAGLALLPAIALAGGLALGGLKVALAGVGDALSAGLAGDTEAFAEALKGLSPNARDFAREVVGLRGRLGELKTTVQDAFFGEFPKRVSELGKTFLPLVETALARVAGGFGSAAREAADFLLLPSSVQMLKGSLGMASIAVTNLTAGLANLLRALLPVVAVGTGFLPQLTSGFESATSRLAAMSTEAQRSGAMVTWIQGALDGLRGMWQSAKLLGGILSDVGAIGATVFGASGLGGSTGGLLTKLADLTSRARSFIESTRGAEVLQTIFGLIGEAVANLRQPIERAFGILGEVIGPLLPDLLDLWRAFSDLKNVVINLGLDVLEPALKGIGAVLDTTVLPALTATLGFLADNEPVLQGIAIAITTLLVPAFVAWAISAGTAAVATIAATWPIIAIGVAIAALAALVIIHFDTIKRWITGVFNWVKNNWPLLLAILTGPFGLAALLIAKNWNSIKAGATAVKDWVVGKLTAVKDFVVGLPSKITNAAAGMWDGISSAFKSMLNMIIGWWNNLSFPSLSINQDIPDWLPGPDSLSFTIGGWQLPNIPTLHAGGTFRAPRPGGEGLALLRDQERVLTPEQADAGGTVIVHVHVRGSVLAERDVTSTINRGVDKGRQILRRGRRG